MTTSAQETWSAIAQQFAAGVSVTAIAKRFNVSRGRIARRAKADGWTRDRAGDRHASADQQAPVAAPGSASGGGEAAGQVADPDPVAALRRRHKAAWKDVYWLREEAHRILTGEASTFVGNVAFHGLEDRLSLAAQLIAIFKRDAKALMMAQDGERRAYGVDYRQQQREEAGDEAAARGRRELTDSILKWVDDTRRMADASSQAAETPPVPKEAPQQSKGRSEPGTGRGC